MTLRIADRQTRMTALRLSHGQVAQVMGLSNLASGIHGSALHSMIRKLRRSHVPFTDDEMVKENPRDEVVYEFVHLAELGLALKLLDEGMRFGHAVELVSRHRLVLRRFYREALLEAETGRGTPIPMTTLDPAGTDPETGESIYQHAAGLYLDFVAQRRNGVLLMAEPRLLDPKEAISRFMSVADGLYMTPLVALSQLCTRIEKVASATPPVKRGPKPRQ